jgi:8-oxo-dGTP diphosphatase
MVAVVTWTPTNSEGYATPAALATDVVVLTVRDGALRVLTLARDDGVRALPGGFVGAQETPEQTARRKLHLKTGLDDLYLEQLASFADPGRDPRGWIPTIAYLALVPPDTQVDDGDWTALTDHPAFAFDHGEIVRTAVERLEGKLWWSNVAVGMLPGPFTMTDARRVYEAVAGRAYDAATFARDLKATGLVEATGERRSEGAGRPAALYRFIDREPRWGAGRRKRVSA